MHTEINSVSQARSSRIVQTMEEHPWWFVPLWAVAYLSAILPAAKRPLWYDELVTVYVARSNSWHELMDKIRHVDLNPPLGYLAVRPFMLLFGENPFAVRFCSIIAFFFTGLLIFEIVRRRMGGAFALLAFGLYLECGFLRYAVEARSYALLLGFYALGVLSWLICTEKQSWSFAHFGLAASISGMILTHCFGPLYAASIGCGELARTITSHQIDKRTWSVLLLPLPLGLTYLTLTSPKVLLFPPAFQANYQTPLWVYGMLFISLGTSLLVMLLLAALPPIRPISLWCVMRPHELAFAVSGLLVPLLIIFYAIHGKIAFWPRYAMGFVIGGTLLAVAAFAALSGRRSSTAAIAAAVVFSIFCLRHITSAKPLPTSTEYRQVCPNLPFVTASGLTFVEMDYREPPDFVNRLYYLTDRDAAIRFAHATIFEGFSDVKKNGWLPFKANVEAYRSFVAQNRYFIVLATPGYPEDWLLPKLAHDGAQFRYLGRIPTGYKDQMLFEVRVPAGDERGSAIENDNCGAPINQMPPAKNVPSTR